MSKNICVLAILLVLSACAPRGMIQFANPVSDATPHEIWVANFRSPLPPDEGQRSPPRPDDLRFEMDLVSVPPSHKTGEIEWPDKTPDAATDFVTLSSQAYPTAAKFADAVLRSDAGHTGETLLFVHGYNYTHGEAVYQLAQISHDFEVPSPTVLFSWPSAAVPVGYLYDRDSALIARDQLEDVIIALTQDSGRKLTILGHSMGNLLVMETLRQIEISGSVDIPSKISSLIMVSPDIDGELFYTQAARLEQLPQPSVIIAASQDSALRISAFLTGRTNRLGSATDRRAVRDLPITVIDASDLSNGGNNHSIALTSPAAIAIIKNANQRVLPGELFTPQVVKLTDLR